jgi:hypothetical protein
MKYVESWWVEELPNRIFHLLINTTKKWLEFRRFSDVEYRIIEFLDSEDLTIPEFLPKDVKFVCTETQDGNQISFYWIPIEKDYIKKRKFILSSD